MTRFTWGVFRAAALIGIVTLFTACAAPPLGPDEVEVEHTRMGYSCKTQAQSDKIDANWSKLDAGMTVIEIDQLIGLPFPALGTTASAINISEAFEVDYCGLFLVFRNGQLTQKPLKPASKNWGSDYQQTWTTRRKKSPLHVAAEKGDPEAVRRLLADGADRTTLDKDGEMPIHKAAAKGDVAVIRLLMIDPNDVNAKSRSHYDQGRTPLYIASASGNLDAAEFLIRAGADVNAKTTSEYTRGATPLDVAVGSGRLDLVNLLIAHGADVNGAGGTAPLKSTVIWRTMNKTRPHQFIEIAAALLQKGADVNAAETDGKTALHTVAWHCDEEFIRLLLANKANVNARDKQGQTPLAGAQSRNCGATVQLLQQAGGVK